MFAATKRILPHVAAAALAALGLGGCPPSSTDGGDDDSTGAAIELAGSWSATFSCSVVQSLSGVSGGPSTESAPLSIEFDESGVLKSLTVIGFTNAPDLAAQVSRVGDVATLTGSNGTLNVTLLVRVTQILYAADSARITLAIEYAGEQGQLTQNGTATQTVNVIKSGSQLSYTVEVSYDVTQVAGVATLDTGETVECEGLATKN